MRNLLSLPLGLRTLLFVLLMPVSLIATLAVASALGAGAVVTAVIGAGVVIALALVFAPELYKSAGAIGAGIASFLALSIYAAGITILTPSMTWAQTVSDTVTLPGDWMSLIPLAMAFLAPMLVGWIKKQLFTPVKQPDGSVVQVLPKWFPKWTPLVLAPVLIIASDLLVKLLGGDGVSPVMLALLSPWPTYIREIGDQFKKAKTA